MLHFLRFFIVRMFLKGATQKKKSALMEILGIKTLFQGKLSTRKVAKTL